MNIPSLYESSIPGLPMHRGKVRDVYDLGETLLIVSTDRLSAFDVVFPDPIPLKGVVLNRLSVWWFNRTTALVPNHMITAEVDEFPALLKPYRAQLVNRSMIVKKTKPIAGEFVIRGYLDGSAWTSYQYNKQVCGIELLAGLQRRSCFGAPLFTPTTKAEEGHDMPIDFAELVRHVGRREAETGRDYSNALYTYAHNFLHGHDVILSDTKFEFGLLPDGTIILIDEALTPDSSRFWQKDTYNPDSKSPKSFDKQYVRDYVEFINWSKEPPAPQLPAEVIQQTTERYLQAYRIVTGKELTVGG